MRHHQPSITLWAAIIMAGICSVPSWAGNTYVEDFTTTTYLDSVNTTADWNTSAGELRLRPLPLSVGVLATSDAYDVFVSDHLVLIADGDSGLRIVDVSDPVAPVEVGHYQPDEGVTRGVHVVGGLAYLAGGGGLRVVDISNPKSPREVSSGKGTDGWSVYVEGRYAYVGGSSSLQVYDVSVPSAPREIASHKVLGRAHDLWAIGNTLYVAADQGGLMIFKRQSKLTRP